MYEVDNTISKLLQVALKVVLYSRFSFSCTIKFYFLLCHKRIDGYGNLFYVLRCHYFIQIS